MKRPPYSPGQPAPASFRMGGTGLSRLAHSDQGTAFPAAWRNVLFVANPIGQLDSLKSEEVADLFTYLRSLK